MPTLRSIAYVSTASHAMSEAELEALLIASRDLNLESGVTGVLLYSDGNFMQCFEGTEQAVCITYARILASRQHRDIIELINEPSDFRHFEDWQMGFARPLQGVLLAISTAHWKQRVARVDGDPASPGMELLKTFWSTARS